ncbi:MAG: ABC transporter ATP-binding protein [Dehalococcoidia bacterium]|nr:ABC transporter ATP-binding protein [Dehalococcoidia bacterium]
MSRWFDPSAPLPPSATVAPVQHVYRRILGHMRLFWRGIGLSVGLAMISSLFITLQPWPIKFIIDGVLVNSRLNLGPLGHVVSDTDDDKLVVGAALAGAYLVITVVGVLFNAASFYAIARTALLMIHNLRSRLVGHVRSLSMRYHANQSVGDTIWRAINDARSIQEVMIFGIRTWTVLVFRLVIMVGFMLLLDPLLTLVSLAVLPLLFITIHRLTARIQRTSQESREHMSRMTSLIEQTMGAIRAVQVFGREGMEQRRFETTSMNFVQAQLKFRRSEQVLNVATVVITGLGTAAVLFFASYRVIHSALTVGSLWVFVSYMQSLYQMMNEIMFVYGPFQDAVVGVGRAFQVLDEASDIREAPDAIAKTSFERSLRFRDVQLQYESGRPVLRGVDFEVCRGEKVAIVGETGSGKTSILNLIPRLYDVTGGAVEMDGVDVRRLKIADLRDLVSMVPQEPLLFAATARENILYGRLDATPEEVRAAATAARADGFIQELSAKYETEVGERGVKLSTGQQQRISIARAFLKNAPILLLDEPTSALDLRTEADFLDGLSELMAGRTVIIVAHRLSTIRNVDRIYFLEDGVFAECGSHEELMQQKGHYYELFMRQFGSGAAEPAIV